MKRLLTALCLLATSVVVAQNSGGIDAAMMEKIRTGYKNTPAERAVKKCPCNNLYCHFGCKWR